MVSRLRFGQVVGCSAPSDFCTTLLWIIDQKLVTFMSTNWQLHSRDANDLDVRVMKFCSEIRFSLVKNFIFLSNSIFVILSGGFWSGCADFHESSSFYETWAQKRPKLSVGKISEFLTRENIISEQNFTKWPARTLPSGKCRCQIIQPFHWNVTGFQHISVQSDVQSRYRCVETESTSDTILWYFYECFGDFCWNG